MARNGIWQLQKLTVNYCDWGGSSRGARDFLQRVLPSFKENNPQIDIAAQVQRGHHPHLKAEYANRGKRVVDVKNKDAGEILEHSLWLRGSAGRKTAHRVKKRHITQQPSVQVVSPVTHLAQGPWRLDVDFGGGPTAQGSSPPGRGAAADVAAAAQ